MKLPDEAIIAGAKAMDAYWGGRYAPDEVEELRGEVTAILEAALPYLSEAARQPQRTSPTDWPDLPKAKR